MSKHDENPAQVDVFDDPQPRPDSQKHSRPQTSAQPWQLQLQHDRENKPTKSDCAFLRDRIVNHSAYKLLRERAPSVSDCAMLNLGCILWVFFSSASPLLQGAGRVHNLLLLCRPVGVLLHLQLLDAMKKWRSHWLCEKTRMVVMSTRFPRHGKRDGTACYACFPGQFALQRACMAALMSVFRDGTTHCRMPS
jgi:hypothetical protein